MLNGVRAFVEHWLLPPGFQDLLRRGYVALIQRIRGHRALVRRNSTLAGRNKGRRCFVLGTGPSIASQDLRPLRNELCISMSNFFKHPDYREVAPAYHCMAPFHDPITEEGWANWMNELDEALVPNATVLFGVADHDRSMGAGRFSRADVFFVDSSGRWPSGSGRIGIDLTRPIPPITSVSIMALSLALYMGCAEAYLLGFDHDWLLHVGESRHFYENKEHALYRSGYQEYFEVSSLEGELLNYYRLWQAYRRMKELAASAGMRIYNSTAGGLLDVFPRVKYETLVGLE